MLVRSCLAAAGFVLCVAASGCLDAAEATSGIPVGERVGTYSSTKCGGIDDGIAVGKSLCYT